MRRLTTLIPAVALLAGCAAAPAGPADPAPTPPGQTSDAAAGTPGAAPAQSPTELTTDESGRPFAVRATATFDEPWAMTFLPDGQALVTERGGTLSLVDPETGERAQVDGTPQVVHAGQGGLGDVILAPTFEDDQGVYLSWVEGGPGGTSGAAVGRATLQIEDTPRLEGLTTIWRQEPKTTGDGHFSHRLATRPDGRHLFVSSGDRQKLDPAQDLDVTLGTIVRLGPDGSPAAGNPFTDRGGVSTQIWSYGHRNALGLAFDDAGRLWSSEMGPRGGDELNLIEEGQNYGWPKASNGDHYDGSDIPDHTAGDGFAAPKVSWTPSISPGSLMIYSGSQFGPWHGDAFLGALSGEALVRVHLDGTNATVADEWDMDARIREVEQGPDGSIWLLEDGSDGRLLKLTPHS